VEIILGAELSTYCSLPGGCATTATETSSSGSSGASSLANLITNADQGVLLSFQAVEGSQSQTTNVYCYAPGCPNEIPWELTSHTGGSNPGVINSYLATISSGGGVSLATLNLPGQQGPIQPVLQRADTSYIGTASTSSGNLMMAFTPGNILWTVPNDAPKIATADGGIIGTSGTTYDSNGKASGQTATSIQSWTGSESGIAYQYGSVDQVALTPPVIYTVPPFWSFAGANQSGSNTSALCHDDRDKLITEYPKYNAGYLPICFASEFVPASNAQPTFHFTFAELNTSDIHFSPPDVPDWAILRAVLLSGLENTRANYGGQAITINSAYRSPLVQNAVSPLFPHDRHIHGDAADMATSSSQMIWNSLHNAAITAGACVEPEAQSTVNHVHADWRSGCPAGWRK
jgi:hypothetical protein